MPSDLFPRTDKKINTDQTSNGPILPFNYYTFIKTGDMDFGFVIGRRIGQN